MAKVRDDQSLRELSEALARLKSPEEYEDFLLDLCTPAELLAMSGRWQVALMLRKKIPYRKINELTGVSTATITRVARFIENGHGGYQKALSQTSTFPQNSDEKN